jgi:hypothetical protein
MVGSKKSNVEWPMSNEQLCKWFSRENIPIEDLVEMWVHLDKNESTRGEIIRLSEESNSKELESRLRHRIQFGTAGTASVLSIDIRSTRANGSWFLSNERLDCNTSFTGLYSTFHSNVRDWRNTFFNM